MRLPFYDGSRAALSEIEVSPDDVLVHVDAGPLGYRGSYRVPFADFCELVRVGIETNRRAKEEKYFIPKPTKGVKT
jgi:hypothetical protein